MAEIIFTYKGMDINIQCQLKDMIKDVINKFLGKINEKNNTNLYYLYSGFLINKELTFNEHANFIDVDRKEMNILVIDNNFLEAYIKNLLSREMICPICKENCLIEINDFKITFQKCKNDHISKDIYLYKFEETQTINLNEIICDICKNNNRGNTHENKFYICNNCNKNLCILCKQNHDKNHKILNYDNKNYICKKHNNTFSKYCRSCDENICIFCKDDHINHNILELTELLLKKDDFEVLKKLKESIDKYKYKVKIIKETFDKMIDILDKYYKITNDIFNDYNLNKLNYYKLLSINNFKNNNEKIIKEINSVINSDNVNEIYKYSFDNFYNINGEKYIGDFKNGLKDGKGIFYFNKDDKIQRMKYEGEFKNDKREGKGILYWNCGDKYEGDFKNNNIEGEGIINYINGDKYQGHFKNGVKEDKGIFYWKNGDKYDGDWKNNKRDGKGIMYYHDGTIEDGDWSDDKFQKKLLNFWPFK